jgi:hypothetical protein
MLWEGFDIKTLRRLTRAVITQLLLMTNVKFTAEQTMNSHSGRRDIAILFLYLSAR